MGIERRPLLTRNSAFRTMMLYPMCSLVLGSGLQAQSTPNPLFSVCSTMRIWRRPLQTRFVPPECTGHSRG